MKKKFKIIDTSTGEKYKLGEGEMLVMNSQGIFFVIGGLNDYYMGMRKLSDVCPRYEVMWKGGD
ncbi:hypothetical protein [Robertmurraya sp.]|uniref:hypothetical protein n=1 Tax=Robertmurraya sp. TaxID=2837525 RepID=UPI00370376DE